MLKMLKENERLKLVGSTALRAPDGTPLPSVPMYVIETVDSDTPEAKAVSVSYDEGLLHKDIAGLFKQYVESIKALGPTV